MAVFFVLLLVPIMIQHFEIRSDHINYEKKNRIALAVFFVILAVLLMLRHESVGNDTRNYIHYFGIFAELEWGKLPQTSNEIGYVFLNKILSYISKEPQFFIAVTSLVTCAMIYPTYRRLCEDPSLTIVLFCTMTTFVMLFSGIRQNLAIAIGCLAYEFTRKKKLIPFIVCVILAVAFHTSAFMLIFMYPLFHTKITKNWLFAVVPILAVVFVFNKQIFLVLSYFLEKFTGYDGSLSQSTAYTMIFLFAIFAVFAFVVPQEASLDKETIGLRNFLLLSLVLQMFAPLHGIAMRMNYYYIIFIPLLLPKIIECKSERFRQVAVVGRHAMIIFFLGYFFLHAYSGGSLHVFPYHFFWETI